MSTRVIVLIILALTTVAARPADVPFTAPGAGPAGVDVIGAVPRGDRFFVVTRSMRDHTVHLFGVRVAPTGEVLDPHPVLLTSHPVDIHSRSHTVRTDSGGATYLETLVYIRDGDDMDYSIERRLLDLENVRVVSTESSFREHREAYAPKNARGETLAVSAENGPAATVWFVGSDGARRKPVRLEIDAYANTTVLPYGEDEWLILGENQRTTYWYRLSEARRDNPMKLSFTYSYGTYEHVRKATAAAPDGEFAVLTESFLASGGGRYRRTLTLRVIQPNGALVQHTLINAEAVDGSIHTNSVTGSASLAKDGDAWLVAHTWWDMTGTNELRVWRVAGSPSLTRLDSYVHPRHQGMGMAPLLVSGLTHNLLLFTKPASFDARVTRMQHVHAWGRGTSPSPDASGRAFLTAPPRQTQPDAASGPSGIMAVWSENELDSYARFFTAGSTAAEPVRLSSPFFHAMRAAVARNGDTFAVVWVEWRYSEAAANWYDRQRVLLRRFDASGELVDTEPLVLWDRTNARYMPRTPGVAVGAETDGFRIAWHGRSLELLANNDIPAQSVFTTHIAARATTFPNPEPVTPNYLQAAEPAIVSDGTDSLLLWKQGIAPTNNYYAQGTVDIYAQRYVGGIARGGTFRLTRGSKMAVAAHAGDLLLVTARVEGEGYCTDAQRFTFSGAALAPAATLDCRSGGDIIAARPAATWDNGQWWVTVAGIRVTHVHQLTTDLAPRELFRFFPDATPSLATVLVPTGRGPTAVYTRLDPTLGLAERGFLRPLPWPRGRAVRH